MLTLSPVCREIFLVGAGYQYIPFHVGQAVHKLYGYWENRHMLAGVAISFHINF